MLPTTCVCVLQIALVGFPPKGSDWKHLAEFILEVMEAGDVTSEVTNFLPTEWPIKDTINQPGHNFTFSRGSTIYLDVATTKTLEKKKAWVSTKPIAYNKRAHPNLVWTILANP